MKYLAIFFIFFFIGVAGMGIYYYLRIYTAVGTTFFPSQTTAFSLANAPQKSEKGTITSLSGAVYWLSRIASSPVQLTSSQQIQQGEELSTGANGKATVQMQKNTSVSLAQNSHITLIQLLPLNFVIRQSQGNVTYENSGMTPLSIVTLGLLTKIDHGIASITVNQNTNTVAVTVLNGSVTEAYEDANNTSNVVPVSSESNFYFDNNAQQGTLQ